MENAPAYDTKAGIDRMLWTLEGFNELVKLRKEARGREEKLGTFLVLGRWSLDCCGNLWKIGEDEDLVPKKLFPSIPKELFPNIPNVLTRDEFLDYLEIRGRKRRDVPRMMKIFSPLLPKISDQCSVCHVRWNIDNCHDFIHDDRRGSSYHPDCYHKYMRREEERHFREIFTNAGYKSLTLEAIPNQYHGDCDQCAPWFKIETEHGKFIVGWRRRVISIDWTNIGKDFSHLFKQENVTKGYYSIHAWGADKATEYLKIVREYLEKGLPQ